VAEFDQIVTGLVQVADRAFKAPQDGQLLHLVEHAQRQRAVLDDCHSDAERDGSAEQDRRHVVDGQVAGTVERTGHGQQRGGRQGNHRQPVHQPLQKDHRCTARELREGQPGQPQHSAVALADGGRGGIGRGRGGQPAQRAHADHAQEVAPLEVAQRPVGALEQQRGDEQPQREVAQILGKSLSAGDGHDSDEHDSNEQQSGEDLAAIAAHGATSE